MKNKSGLYLCPFFAAVLLLLSGCNHNNSSDLVIDGDGNEYQTVVIGDQVWTVENLRTTRYNDGIEIPEVTDDAEWQELTSAATSTYKNTSDPDTIQTYGRLYNWYAVDSGKLCPSGWHVPSQEEFLTLRNYLIANGYNYDNSTSGNAGAKSLATNWGWVSSDMTGAVGNDDYPEKQNATGFTALPAGQRYTISNDMGYFGSWWSSTEENETHSWEMYLSYALSPIYINISKKQFGLSVRCVED